MVSLWPDGVRSKVDTQYFCQMMLGREQMKLAFDYEARMPSFRDDCFLLFIQGGCVEGTPLSGLRACVPELMAELRALAQCPDAAVRTGSIHGDSWYDHAQLSKSSCTCRLNFGGEKGKTRKNQRVDCQGLQAGRKYEEVLLQAIRSNTPAHPARVPVYFEKAFHALLNDTDHRKKHRIGAHSDEFPGSYDSQDPIMSLSWGCAGVLVLSPAPKTQGVQHLTVAKHGDVTVMSGEFQQHFLHAVPPVSDWPALLAIHKHELLDWEITAMQDEITAMADEGSGDRKRQNSTIRWHHNHSGCLWSQKPVNISPIPMSQVAAAISQFSVHSFVNPESVSKLGTGNYRPFGRGSVSSTVPNLSQ